MSGASVVEGFNLLPYRLRKRREMRRQRLAILAAASLAGCAAVGAVAGWDALQRARLDERRLALEASLRTSGAQLEEHARLTRAEADRRRARQNAQPLAAPRDRFLALLDALADAPGNPASSCNASRNGPTKSNSRRSHPIRKRRRTGSSVWRTCATCSRWK
jgi:hypothetical protein